MNIKEKMKTIISERERISIETQDEWDYGIEQCRKKEIEILSNDITDTISYLLNECSANEFSWISEVFDEVAEKTQSSEFINTLYKLVLKFPEETKKYNLISCVESAKSLLFNEQ